MTAPVIVVTGGIGSGKSTVAETIAGRGGYIIDADALAHRALKDDSFKGKLREAFGDDVFTPSGRVSRARLANRVFSDTKRLWQLDRLIRPFVRKIVSEVVSNRREQEKYIVLDAVLFFQYKFRFKAGLVVLTEAIEKTCLRRIMKRDGFSIVEAEQRIESQRRLKKDWLRADVKIDTDTGIRSVRAEAERIRDDFLKKYRII